MGYREWTSVGNFVSTWGRVLGKKTKLTTLLIDEVLDAMGGTMEPDLREVLAKGMGYLAEFGYTLREDPEMIQPEAVSHQYPVVNFLSLFLVTVPYQVRDH